MNKVDLKLNAVANAKAHYKLLLTPNNGALISLLDTLMSVADASIDHETVRDELEQLIIWKATEYSRAKAA